MKEPIESLCYLFIEMAISDGQMEKVEAETILEMITDLLNSDEGKVLSKRSSTDAMIIVPKAIDFYFENRSPELVKNVLVELNNYLTHEEKVLTTNMLVHLAKINGDVDPGEIEFFNYVKRSWELV